MTIKRGPMAPSTIQGRVTALPKPTIATCGIDDAVQHLDAALAETGDGNRGIRQFRTANAPGASALNEIAHAGHEFVERHPVDIVQRRGRQCTTANGDRHPDMHRGCAFVAGIPIKAIEGGETARGQADGFDRERRQQQPGVRRPCGVRLRALRRPDVADNSAGFPASTGHSGGEHGRIPEGRDRGNPPAH